jgi:ribosomal protein L44E
MVKQEMRSEKRWCEKCRDITLHEILDSDKVMVGKKTKFLYKCVNCGKKKRMPAFRGMAESTY